MAEGAQDAEPSATQSQAPNTEASDSKESLFLCDICSKAFKRSYNLNRHRLIHSELKPFLCLDCDKTFADKGNLLKHNRTHVGKRPFPCDLCGKSFTSSYNLLRHLKRLHAPLQSPLCTSWNWSLVEFGFCNNYCLQSRWYCFFYFCSFVLNVICSSEKWEIMLALNIKHVFLMKLMKQIQGLSKVFKRLYEKIWEESFVELEDGLTFNWIIENLRL